MWMHQHATGKAKLNDMPKHFFFDLDKTLTMSRSLMAADHVPVFNRLCRERDVVVVTGGNMKSIQEQLPTESTGMYYVLAQSGNHAIDKNGSVLWYEKLTDEQTNAILAFIEVLKKDFNIPVKDEHDLVEHRGAQIGYSVLGYHEDVTKKYAFDPGDAKRAAALAAHPREVENLHSHGIEAVPGGTTTINFYALGKHKGFNIARFLAHMGWQKNDCVYVGDALFPGGNDETVIGVIPTHAVKDHNETFDFVRKTLV